MDVKKTNIKRFITSSDIVFVIPVYQRNYDWKKANCVQLFSDIKNLIRNDKTHFIGTVCYKMDGRYKSVIIDGQQRITTVMLLLKALHDICEDEKLKKKINEQFLTNPYSEGELKLKLKPIKKDEETYKRIMEGDSLLTDEQKDSNTNTNYLLFKDLLKETLKTCTAEEIEDAIERLEIVEISLTDENPQVIFESLNSTGLGLTNTDLLRNYLLMSLDYPTQERLYQSYWLKIEELLGSDMMEQFMVDYLILNRQSVSVSENGKKAKISARNLYYSFKKQFPNIFGPDAKDVVESYFVEMYKYAKYYKHFLYSDKSDYLKLDDLDKKLYELFYQLNASTASILVMWLFEKRATDAITEEQLLEAIDICISFAFRTKVCGLYGMSDQFAALAVQKLDAIEIDDNFINNFWVAISSGNGKYSFPTDNEFKFALSNVNVYQTLRSSGTKYLLYKLEKSLPHSKELPIYEEGSIEHIMPQTLSKEWVEYIKNNNDYETYEKYLHTLGNLALTSYNSELSNKLFEEKKKEYLLSNYSLTKKLSEYESWNNSNIHKRSELLSEMAVNVWPTKGDIQKSEAEIGVTYDLQADFDSFYGTKPSKCCVLNEEKEVINWSEFMLFACQKFYDFDSENFVKLVNYDKFPSTKPVIAKSEKALRAPKKIVDGLYFEANQSTPALLKEIKCIVEYFEEIYESDLQSTVWFAIRKA